MEKSPSNLAPFVYWAQSTTEVTLRVDLKDVKEPHLMVEEEEIEFAAVGVGSHGKQRWVEERGMWVGSHRVISKQLLNKNDTDLEISASLNSFSLILEKTIESSDPDAGTALSWSSTCL